MVDFFITYWKLITLVILLFANLLVAIFKRPKVLNTVLELANAFVPTAINEAEGNFGAGNGAAKLNYATKLVLDYITYRFNLTQREADKYVGAIQAEIEKILSTPQKKEEK